MHAQGKFCFLLFLVIRSLSFYYETVYFVISSCVFDMSLCFVVLSFFCIILGICNSSLWFLRGFFVFSHLLAGFVICPILWSCCVSHCVLYVSPYLLLCFALQGHRNVLFCGFLGFLFFLFLEVNKLSCWVEVKTSWKNSFFAGEWSQARGAPGKAWPGSTAASLAGPQPATCRNTWRPKGLHIQTPRLTNKSKWLLINEPELHFDPSLFTVLPEKSHDSAAHVV